MLNSKMLRCNISKMRSCSLCYERPLFFNDEDLTRHHKKYHNGCTNQQESTKMFVAKRELLIKEIKSVEASKRSSVTELEEMTAQLRQLGDEDLMFKKHTIDIVRREMCDLQKTISREELEIKELNELLATIEEEILPCGPLPQTIESKSNQISDLVLDRKNKKLPTATAEQRLYILEAEVKLLKEQSPDKMISELVKMTEVESKSNDRKIQMLTQEIHNLKLSLSSMHSGDNGSKLELLQKHLAAAHMELHEKAELLKKLQNETVGHCAKEFTLEDEQEYNRKLAALQEQHDSLIEKERLGAIRSRQELDEVKKETEKIVADQKQQIEVLLDEKKSADIKMKAVAINRDGVKQELQEITEQYSKCRRTMKDMNMSYETSLQNMRGQMEELLKEESQLTNKLEKELHEKEGAFRGEVDRLEDEVSLHKSENVKLLKKFEEDEVALERINKEEGKQQQLSKEENALLRDKIGQLKTELMMTLEHQTGDTEKVVVLENLLQEEKEAKKNLSAKFEKEREGLLRELQEVSSKLEQRVLDVESSRLAEEEEEHKCLKFISENENLMLELFQKKEQIIEDSILLHSNDDILNREMRRKSEVKSISFVDASVANSNFVFDESLNIDSAPCSSDIDCAFSDDDDFGTKLVRKESVFVKFRSLKDLSDSDSTTSFSTSSDSSDEKDEVSSDENPLTRIFFESDSKPQKRQTKRIQKKKKKKKTSKKASKKSGTIKRNSTVTLKVETPLLLDSKSGTIGGTPSTKPDNAPFPTDIPKLINNAAGLTSEINLLPVKSQKEVPTEIPQQMNNAEGETSEIELLTVKSQKEVPQRNC